MDQHPNPRSAQVPATNAIPDLCNLWLAAVSLAIAFGTLIPFQLDPAKLLGATHGGLLGLTFYAPPLHDVVTNVAIYLPVGLVFGLTLGFNKSSVWRAALFAAMLSLVLERIQVAAPLRVASWIDVALNCLGGVAGCLVAVPLAAGFRIVARKMSARPFAALFAMSVLAALTWSVFPLDFVTDSHALRQAFLTAQWSPLSFWTLSANLDTLDRLTNAATLCLFATLLAYLSTRSADESGCTRHKAIVEGISHTLIVLTVMVAMQVFMASGSLDFGSVPLVLLCIGAGIWLATFTAHHKVATVGHAVRSIPIEILVASCVVQVFLWISSACTSATSAALNSWIPFVDLWRGSMVSALHTSSGYVLATTGLAVPTYMIMYRSRVRGFAWCFTIAITFLTAASAAFAKAYAGMTDTIQPVVDTTLIVTSTCTVLTLAALSKSLSFGKSK